MMETRGREELEPRWAARPSDATTPGPLKSLRGAKRTVGQRCGYVALCEGGTRLPDFRAVVS